MDNKMMAENIRVAVRFRPHNKKEEGKDGNFRYNLTNNSVEVIVDGNTQHTFLYDYVFDKNTSQERVFDTVAKNTIEWVCQGYNSTIFAYGNTSSGKTYTMFGESSKENSGIVPRACKEIFSLIEKRDDVIEASMKVSFLEIYREHIKDLLDVNRSDLYDPNLKIRQSTIKGVYVQGLTEKYVYSPEDTLSAIASGMALRTTASTALNAVSSRSHAVLTLYLTQKMVDGSEINSKLHLVDLAGSENVGKSEVQGVALAEAQMINKSLSCLGNVIYALTEKNREHIPYRDSKLTYLLEDSLGGNSRTILLAAISPSALSYSESLNTLKFAKRVKEIKNIPKVNKNESMESMLKLIEELKAENAKLKEGNKFGDTPIDTTNNTSLTQKLEKTQTARIRQRCFSESLAKSLYEEKLKNLVLQENNRKISEFLISAKSLLDTPNVLAIVMKKFLDKNGDNLHSCYTETSKTDVEDGIEENYAKITEIDTPE